MVSAWYMDDNRDADQRLPHKPEAPVHVSTTDLKKLGVDYWWLDPLNYKENPEFQRIKTERGYSYQDEIKCSPECLENYESKIKSFYDEHIHTDEEIRYILEGSGYFDVRDFDDKWIRIAVGPGDLIVLPAGIYHRFTLDTSNYIRAVRLFVGEPIWTPHSRSAMGGDHPSVQSYRQTFAMTNLQGA